MKTRSVNKHHEAFSSMWIIFKIHLLLLYLFNEVELDILRVTFEMYFQYVVYRRTVCV